MSTTGETSTAAPKHAAGTATRAIPTTASSTNGLSAPGSAAASSGSAAGGTAEASTSTVTQSATTARSATPARGRRVKLTVARVDPWSVMKMSFLLSVAIGIATVIMVFVLWTILSGMGVFDQVDSIISQVQAGSDTKTFSVKDFVGLGRVLSLSVVIAVLDVIIMTAMATLGAFLYNVCSALVGGVQLTLTDD